ncbi:MAG: hypothetical protein R2845_09250 [Thermomicrobiales bacterium]
MIARDLETGDETVLLMNCPGVYPITTSATRPVQIGGSIALVLTDPKTAVLVDLPADLTDAPVIVTPKPRRPRQPRDRADRPAGIHR